MRAIDGDFRTRVPIRLPYRAFLPDGYEEAREGWPLILFLHGIAERGDDPARLVAQGLPRRLAEGRALPFVVVAPQCPRNQDWSMILPALDALLDHLLAGFRIDPHRVCLTGLSLGGFGVWALATEYPDRFAAAAPICGGGRHLLDFPERLRRIVGLPVWSFHGGRDEVVPAGESQRLVEALRDYGGTVRSTVYPEAGHDCWTRTYDDPALYDWFLQQRRR